MSKHGITFGTDGWRALIAEGFTVERVRIVAQAFADWLKRAHRTRRKVLIGFDGRFGGERFALAAASVLEGNSFHVDVVSSPTPTPAVSWWILKRRYAGGLMITASHNPPAYSGIKIKPDFGGSPDETVIGPIVANLGVRPPRAGNLKAVRRVAFTDGYVRSLRRFVDLRALKRLRGTVVGDPMGGVQTGLLARVLSGTPLRVVSIHDRLDPLFCGLKSPEPVEENLADLKVAVRRTRARLGIATDGDGDRVGIVADGGRFLTPHIVLALLVLFMVRWRKLTGGVVKTVSGSYLMDRIARAHRLPLYETPVGFKYICKLMREKPILIGGEESGGVGFQGYIPERDGLLTGLLFLELLAKSGKSCRRLVADLTREFGASNYARIDTHHAQAATALKRLIANPPSRVGGERVARVNTMDGLKLILPDDAWLLFRASGTEPLLRIYAESRTRARTRRLLNAGARLAGVKR